MVSDGTSSYAWAWDSVYENTNSSKMTIPRSGWVALNKENHFLPFVVYKEKISAQFGGKASILFAGGSTDGIEHMYFRNALQNPANFIPMGDRELLVEYKSLLKKGKDSLEARAAAGIFIDLHVAIAEMYVPMLLNILESTRSLHKTAYLKTMEGVRLEPLFPEYVKRVLAIKTLQRSVQRTPDIDTLYQDAEDIADRFSKFVNALGNKTRAVVILHTIESKNFGRKVSKLKLKNPVRVLEKTGLRADRTKKYEAEGVCDIVRGALQYNQMADFGNVLELLLACDDDQESTEDSEHVKKLLFPGATDDARIVIVRIKDRFSKPTTGGWSDTMINFYFANDCNKHICEVQLVHARMMTVRKEREAHKGYSQFRTALELLEAIDKAPVEEIDEEDEEEASDSVEKLAKVVQKQQRQIEKQQKQIYRQQRQIEKQQQQIGKLIASKQEQQQQVESLVEHISAITDRLDRIEEKRQ
eukprot:m.85664 g.85664  ORF g.85664 m.85664 type:complete len:472 (-) comp13018_c1_seq9:1570-2985(-)